MTDAQSDFTPNLSLPFLLPAQAQKHVTVNESLAAIDALLMGAVTRADLTGPPSEPANGEAFIVGADSSGDWAGRTAQLAVWADGAWQFHAPQAGWRVWNKQEDALLVFDGTLWRGLSGSEEKFQNLEQLGVATTADSDNPLSVRGPGALLTALPTVDGGSGDIRLAVNAEAGAHTASIVFQSGWSGRGEIGLTSDNMYSVRCSADGADWTDAIKIDPATGHIGLGTPPDSAETVTIGGAAKIAGEAGSVHLRGTGSVDIENAVGGPAYLKVTSPSTYLQLGVTGANGEALSNGFVMRPNAEDILFGFDLAPFNYGDSDVGKSSWPFRNCYLINAPIISSDRRGKTNIETFDAGLELLRGLNPVTFRRDGDGETRHVGLIAQQVRSTLEDAELTGLGIWMLADPADEDSSQAISYSELVPVLIDAVNELAERVEELEARGR